MKIRVGHLYPDYLNIYADRGNIAVLDAACAPRGHELDVTAISRRRRGAAGRARPALHRRRPGPRAGADRAGPRREGPAIGARSTRAQRCSPSAAATSCSAAAIATGMASSLPGVGLFPHDTVAGERRMIGDVLLDCELVPGEHRTLAGFENHAGRTRLDPGAEPLGRVIAGFGNDGESGYEGVRVGRAIGTYLHGPLLPRNPWLADWLLVAGARARDRRRAARAGATARPARGRGARRFCGARAPPRRPLLGLDPGGGGPVARPAERVGRPDRVAVPARCRSAIGDLHLLPHSYPPRVAARLRDGGRAPVPAPRQSPSRPRTASARRETAASAAPPGGRSGSRRMAFASRVSRSRAARGTESPCTPGTSRGSRCSVRPP